MDKRHPFTFMRLPRSVSSKRVLTLLLLAGFLLGEFVLNISGQGWLEQVLESRGKLELTESKDAPVHGTFWSLQRTNWPPLPYNPFRDHPDIPVSYLYGNSYLLWDLEVDYDAIHKQHKLARAQAILQVEFGLSAKESEAVLETEVGLEWAMELEEAGIQMSMAYSYAPGTFYLEIGEVSTNASLTLRGTSGENLYSVQSTESLTNPQWLTERVVQGAAGQDWTELAVPVGTRTNSLFFRGLQHGESDASTNGLTVSITSPTDGTYYPTWPTNITLQATASSANGAIVGVGFYAGSTLVGFDDQAPYQATWNDAMRGTYALTARAFDIAGGSLRSPPVNISVDPCYPAVDVMLVVDKSGSMTNPPTKLRDAKTACSNFVAFLSFPADQAGLVSFSTTASTDRTLTMSQTALLTSIGQITGGGSTYMSNAIRAARLELTSSRRNTNALPVMVFFSDGEPTDNTNSVLAEASRAKTNDHIRVFTIGLGAANHALMRSIASTTNDYFYTTDSSELSGLFAAVAARLCRTAPVVEMVWPTNNATFIYPQVFNLRARATDADGGIVSVRFYNGSQPVGLASPVAGTNLWSFTWNGAALGTNLLTAVAVDNSGLESTSPPTTVVLTHPAPTIQITAPTNGQFFAYSPTNILLSANPIASGGPVTDVEFLANSESIGHATTLPWQVLWVNVAAASNYTITAIATDHLGYKATNEISIGVNAMPQVAWVSPTNWQRFIDTNAVELRASASDSDGAVAGVVFELLSGESFSGTQTNANQWMRRTNLAVGSYAAMAVGADNRGAKSASELRLFEVTSTNNSPSVLLTWPTNGAIFRDGADITLTAVASNGVPGGTVTNVQFFCGGRLLGADATAPYNLKECCWSPGTYELRAVAMDTLGNGGVSEGVKITVEKADSLGSGFWDIEFQPTYSPVFQFYGWVLVSAIKSAGTDLYVGAMREWNGVILKWDGTDWTYLWPQEGGFDPGKTYAIEVEGTNVYAAIYDRVIRWNGADWELVGTNLVPAELPFQDSSRIENHRMDLAVVGEDLYVGGAFSATVDDTNIQYIARLNKTNNCWEAVGNGLDGPVLAIESMGGALYIGGLFTSAGGNTNLNGIARLEDNTWANLGTGLEGTNSAGARGGVFCLAACGTNLFAGGDFTTAGGNTNGRGIAVWNTREWNPIHRGLGPFDQEPDYLPECIVYSIAVRGDTLYAAGRFGKAWVDETTAIATANIAQARWSESQQSWSWSDLDFGIFHYWSDPGFTGFGLATAIMEGSSPGAYDLIVGGSFRQAGPTVFQDYPPSPDPNCLARWRVGHPPGSRPSVSVIEPAANAVLTDTSMVELYATASSYTNINSAWFVIDDQPAMQAWPVSNDVYNVYWYDPSPGVHQVRAVAVNADEIRGDSRPVLVTVKSSTNTVYASDDQYSLIEGGGTIALPVLSNDVSSTAFRISRVTQPQGPLGRALAGYDGSFVSYMPFERRHGTERFYYTITNSLGDSDSAWVTVNLLSRPEVWIDSPWDGQRLGVSSAVTVSGSSHSHDWERPVTNVTLLVNGSSFAQTSNTDNLSFSWSNSVRGYYTFEAIATDSVGVSNRSPRVTVALTNGAFSQPPVAKIMNLQGGVTQLSGMEIETPPVIRQGLLDLKGRAYDPDAGDPVCYQVLLYRQQDWADLGDLAQLVGEGFEPFADVTPGPKNYQGFHIGGDVGGSSGGGLTPETPGDLGQLDLTAIPNGVYDLVLRVRGGSDETNAIVRVQIESNLKLGQFSFSEQDLVLPVNGIPLTVTRTYSSMNPRSGVFGHGWTFALNDMDVQLDEQRTDVTIGSPEAPLSYDDEEEETGGLPRVVSIRTGGGWNVTLTLPDGRRTTFAFKPRAGSGQAYAEWMAPPGIRATLKAWPDSAKYINYYPWLSWADGGYNSTFDNHDIPGWVLETADGTKYYITRGTATHLMWDDTGNSHFIPVVAYEPQPKLSRIEQRSGDVIEISDAAIRHFANGTNLTRSAWFQRDAAGRITALRDPNSGSNGLPVVKYVYNRETENLIQVHRLVDREAGIYATNRYSYDNPNFPHYITSIEDARGVPMVRNEYGEDGRISAITDADGNRTQILRTLTPTNAVEMVIDPLGHTNTTVSDLRGNLIAVTNAVGGFELLTFDPNTDEVLSVTDALNNMTRHGWDTNGSPIMEVSAMNHTNLTFFDVQGIVTGSVDPLGNSTTNLLDVWGNATNSIRKDASGVVVGKSSAFFEGSKLLRTMDALERTNAVYTWIGADLLSMADAKGAVRAFGHDESGNRTSVTNYIDGTNLVERTEFDAQSKPMVNADTLGGTNWTYYTSSGKPDHTADKFGQTNTFLWNAKGLMVQSAGPDGLSRTIYNSNGKPIYVTDRNGVTGTRTDYDAAGQPTNSVRLMNISIDLIQAGPEIWTTKLGNPGSPFATNSTEYFLNGWVKRRTGPEGTPTDYTYWPDGQTKTVTVGLTNTTYYEHNAAGQRNIVADALNHTNRFLFDGAGREIGTVFADGTSISNIVNLLGQRVAKVDQAQVIISNLFDISGALTGVAMPLVPDPENGGYAHPLWTFGLDDHNRELWMLDPKARGTTNLFDIWQRRVAQRLPIGQTNWTRYNELGLVFEQWDFKKQRKLTRHDSRGREATNFWFVSAAASPSNAVEYYRNHLGWITNITERFGEAASESYAASGGGPLPGTSLDRWRTVPPEVQGGGAGLLLLAFALLFIPREKWRELVLVAGRVSRVEPASCRRLRMPGIAWRFVTLIVITALLGSDPKLSGLWTANAECVYPPNPSTENVRVTTFEHDFDGRVTQVNTPEGVINYEYNIATGRLIRVCTANSEVTYGHDGLGRLATVTVLKRNGSTFTPPEVFSITYGAAGNRSTMTLPNGVISSWLYDSLNRLTNLTHSLGGTNLLASYSYGLHPTGRRTNAVEILKTEDAGTPYITNALSWAFDQMYRLTNETCVSSLGAAGSYVDAFQYDLCGNRLSKTHVRNGVTSVTTNLFDANDQLLQEVTWTGSTLAESNAYAWDDNGSMTAKARTAGGTTTTTLYGYNLQNKLDSATTLGTGQTNYFQYNHEGIRVRSIIGGAETRYLADANNLTGYQQILEEFTVTGGVPTLAKSYVIGDDVLGQCGSGTATPHWILYDGRGSTRQLSNPPGGIKSHYTYSAYGVTETTTSSSTLDTNLLYCGEQFDSQLEMYNLRARFYAPSIGRFTTRDTFEGANDDPQSLHKYAYCRADVVNRLDPSGQTDFVSIMSSMNIMLFLAGHELRGGSAAINSARRYGTYNSSMDVAGLLYAMDVAEAVSSAAAVATLVWGGYRLAQWGLAKGAAWFQSANRIMRNLEKQPGSNLFLFENLKPGEILQAPRLTPAYQIVRNKESGFFTYVVMPNGELRLGEQAIRGVRNGHFDLANGQKIIAGGEAVFENGVAKAVNNASGHYHGAGLSLAQKAAHRAATMEAFKSHGLSIVDYFDLF